MLSILSSSGPSQPTNLPALQTPTEVHRSACAAGGETGVSWATGSELAGAGVKEEKACPSSPCTMIQPDWFQNWLHKCMGAQPQTVGQIWSWHHVIHPRGFAQVCGESQGLALYAISGKKGGLGAWRWPMRSIWGCGPWSPPRAGVA